MSSTTFDLELSVDHEYDDDELDIHSLVDRDRRFNLTCDPNIERDLSLHIARADPDYFLLAYDAAIKEHFIVLCDTAARYGYILRVRGNERQ